ncbi:MAG TPA: DUF1127 domain-containing protein [Pseudolabrys sp.]
MTAHSLRSSSSRRQISARFSAPRIILPIAFGAMVQASLVLIAMLVRVAKRLVRGVQNRRAAAVLAHLDARMLADIGLTRSDVRDATAAPMWDDPTTLLRTRALERRLRRHRLDLGFHDQSKK